MILKVIITNRNDAKPIVKDLCSLDIKVCWITICNNTAIPLVKRSNKHILVCKFQDVQVNPITKNQSRKIKNFIINHHINMIDSFVMVVNCHAGISRSAGIGMFAKHNLNLDVSFGKETFPNVGVMKSLGVNPKFWRVEL